MNKLIISIIFAAGYFGTTVESNASGVSKDIGPFSDLKHQFVLSPKDLASINKAEPLLADLKDKNETEHDDNNRRQEYMSLLDSLEGLDQRVALQLSRDLLAYSSSDDYVRQLAVDILFHNIKIDTQSLKEVIEIMVKLDDFRLEMRPFNRGWMTTNGLKGKLGAVIEGILNIPPERQISGDFMIPKSEPWLLKTLELAKEIPRNQKSIPLIDSAIQYVKEKANG